MSDLEYIIIKRGLYYRPNAAGYTGDKNEAGRYSLEEAESRCKLSDGQITFVHENEAERFSPQCWHETKERKYAEEIEVLHDQTKKLCINLLSMIELYCELVNSGDAGNWNPEEETQVIAARAAVNINHNPNAGE